MNITVSQPNGMLLHAVPGHPVWLDSPSPNKLSPQYIPGLSAPEGNARQPSVAASSQAVGHRRIADRASRLAAACRLRQSGRQDRGPVTLPRSGCPVCRSRHPAAFPCRPQSPPPNHTPRHFAVASCGCRRRSRPQDTVPYSSINLSISIDQDPLTPGSPD